MMRAMKRYVCFAYSRLNAHYGSLLSKKLANLKLTNSLKKYKILGQPKSSLLLGFNNLNPSTSIRKYLSITLDDGTTSSIGYGRFTSHPTLSWHMLIPTTPTPFHLRPFASRHGWPIVLDTHIAPGGPAVCACLDTRSMRQPEPCSNLETREIGYELIGKVLTTYLRHWEAVIRRLRPSPNSRTLSKANTVPSTWQQQMLGNDSGGEYT